MNVREAKICLACDEVFEGKTCPRCGEIGALICKWVWPAQPRPENVNLEEGRL